jgi:hypothetical protein
MSRPVTRISSFLPAHEASWRYSSTILKFSIRQRWVVRFTPLPVGKHPATQHMEETEYPSLDVTDKRKISCLYQESNPYPLIVRPTVTVSPELMKVSRKGMGPCYSLGWVIGFIPQIPGSNPGHVGFVLDNPEVGVLWILWFVLTILISEPETYIREQPCLVSARYLQDFAVSASCNMTLGLKQTAHRVCLIHTQRERLMSITPPPLLLSSANEPGRRRWTDCQSNEVSALLLLSEAFLLLVFETDWLLVCCATFRTRLRYTVFQKRV